MHRGGQNGDLSPPAALCTLPARRGQLSPRVLGGHSPSAVRALAVSAGHRRRCRRLWARFERFLAGRRPTVTLMCRFILRMCKVDGYRASTVLTYTDSLSAVWWRRALLPPLRGHPEWTDFVTGLKNLTGKNRTKSAAPASAAHLQEAVGSGSGAPPVLSPLARWVLAFCAHAWSRLGDLADTLASDVYTASGMTVVTAYGAKEARRKRPAPRLVVESSALPSPLPPAADDDLLLSPKVRSEILAFSASLGLTGHSWRRGAIQLSTL